MKAFVGGLAALGILAAAMAFVLDRAAVDSATGFDDTRRVHIDGH